MEKNIVNVLYLDYALYVVVEIYHSTLYMKLKNQSTIEKDKDLDKCLSYYKNIIHLIFSTFIFEYDDEIIKKIMYIKVLQILDEDPGCIQEVQDYINGMIDKNQNIHILEFTGNTLNDALDWIDNIYKTFCVPYLYDYCCKIL